MPTTSFPEKKSNSKMNKKGVAHQVTFSLMSFTCFIPMQKCTFWKNAIRATEWDPFTSNVQCTCKENLAIHSQRQMMLNTCVKSWTSNYMVRMVVLRVLNFIQKLWWFAWSFMVKFCRQRFKFVIDLSKVHTSMHCAYFCPSIEKLIT